MLWFRPKESADVLGAWVAEPDPLAKDSVLHGEVNENEIIGCFNLMTSSTASARTDQGLAAPDIADPKEPGESDEDD